MLSLEEQLNLQDAVIVALCDVITKLCAEFLEHGCSDPAPVLEATLATLAQDLESFERDLPEIMTSESKAEVTIMVCDAILEGISRPSAAPHIQ